MPGGIRAVDGGVEVAVWVVPGARRSEVVGRHGDAVRVRVARPPEDGRANEGVIALLSETLDAKVRLVAGRTSRSKRVLVEGLSEVEVVRRLGL